MDEESYTTIEAMCYEPKQIERIFRAFTLVYTLYPKKKKKLSIFLIGKTKTYFCLF